MRKFFASERFEVNRCGPRNESNPMLPSVPQSGRANPAMVGLARVHWLTPTGGVRLSPPGTDLNQVMFPCASLLAPMSNDPEPLLGRQTPTSWSLSQSL